MSVTFLLERVRPATLPRSIAKTAISLTVFALVVGFVAFVRTFVFEYFHGNPAAMHGLLRALSTT